MILTLYQIAALSIPLLLTSFGALISEYAGRTAVFAEGAVNLGAFLCFALTVKTTSAAAGIILSVSICTVVFYALAHFVEKTGANPFIISLAVNLISGGIISLLSLIMFGTRGILISNEFLFDAKSARFWTTLAGFFLCALTFALLYATKQGLYVRIAADDKDFLEERGISTFRIRNFSWGAAAFFASGAGAVLALRLNSFVPNISSGTGWLSLAAVFLGRKNAGKVSAAVFIFSTSQFVSANLQNWTRFSSVPPSVLQALPYLVALACILLQSGRQKSED